MEDANEVNSDLPGVRRSVVLLGELAKRMKDDEFNFAEDDVGNIDCVIESLMELENERQHMLDKLEAETITASILRFKLGNFPKEIRKEIKEAMAAARNSNHEILTGLQSRLSELKNNMDELEAQLETTERENATLLPEKERIKLEHEEIISMLNQRMADKASKQIELNETRDRVRETNQQIIDLEEGIILLKEDLIQERADARMEKKQLKKAINDTSSKTSDQRVKNKKQQVDLDHLKNKLIQSDTQLEDLRKSIRKHESSRAQLEDEEHELSNQMAEIRRRNQDLRMKQARLNNELTHATLEFQSQQDTKTAQIRKLQYDNMDNEQRAEDLEVQRLEKKEDLHEAMIVRKEDGEKVADLQGALNQAKSALAAKAEDVGRLMLDNKDTMEAIEQLTESHTVFMAQMSKQIDELRETLKKERKERLDVQSKHEAISMGQDEDKLAAQKQIHDINQQIAANKKKHHDLTKELSQLKSHLERMLTTFDEKIEILDRDVSEAQMEYDRTRSYRELQISKIERDIEEMRAGIAWDVEFLQNGEVDFEELTNEFNEKTEEYEGKKKHIVGLRNEQKGCTEACSRYNLRISKHAEPMEKVRGQLKRRRQLSLDMIKEHNVQVRDLETEIYNRSLKLKSVRDENNRFLQGIEKLEGELTDIESRENENKNVTNVLEKMLQDSNDILLDKWKEDKAIERKFASRDSQIVDALGSLLEEAETREKRISGITQRLESEVLSLGSFLDNVSRRRPADVQREASFFEPVSSPTPSMASSVEVVGDWIDWGRDIPTPGDAQSTLPGAADDETKSISSKASVNTRSQKGAEKVARSQKTSAHSSRGGSLLSRDRKSSGISGKSPLPPIEKKE